MLYTFIAGLMMPVPERVILYETIRNLYFHVPMWFTMIFMMLLSGANSALFLSKNKMENDHRASTFALTGMIFGILGLLTGMLWAKNTWGAYWVNDPKLNSAAIGMLIYLAYFLLRQSIDDDLKKARISAVYNLLSLPIFIVLVFILPRITDSLHPGNGGNPAFSQYDLDNRMRLIFYPAVIGWIMLGIWISSLSYRLKILEQNHE